MIFFMKKASFAYNDRSKSRYRGKTSFAWRVGKLRKSGISRRGKSHLYVSAALSPDLCRRIITQVRTFAILAIPSSTIAKRETCWCGGHVVVGKTANFPTLDREIESFPRAERFCWLFRECFDYCFV